MLKSLDTRQNERRKSLALMLGLQENQITAELESKMRAALFRTLGLPETGILGESEGT